MKRQVSTYSVMLILCSAILLVESSSVVADEIHVPANQPTIQAGIDAALTGDEVVVADGTYTGEGNKNLDFNGKAITVRSESGDPALCIIDCEGDGRGFFFHNNEDSSSVLSGITISNGFVSNNSPEGPYGAGAFCDHSSPSMIDCVFKENDASYDNFYAQGMGGGVYNDSSAPVFINCLFQENSARTGGGIYNDRLEPRLINCEFRSNIAVYGGGIYNKNSRSSLKTCLFINNTAGYGGGIYNEDSTYPQQKIMNSCFYGNSGSQGGGIYNNNSHPAITNCVFSGNVTTHDGGGVHNFSSDPEIINCTFSGNNAQHGGSITFFEGSCPTLTNCILWGNGDEIYGSGSILPEVTFSCVRGGYPGEGNISRIPRFVDAYGEDDIPGTEDDNLTLQPDSACNNAGSDEAVPVDLLDLDGDEDTTEPLPYDLSGNTRFVTVVDMGAYEHNDPVPPAPPVLGRLYVNANAEPGGNGLSWETAYVFLQDALVIAEAGAEIWVAVGTYSPDEWGELPEKKGQQNESFWIIDGVKLYGGFSGDETELNERPCDPNPFVVDPLTDSILSGNIGIVDEEDDNSFHVVQTHFAYSGITLNGFSIIDGHAQQEGGGMFNFHSNPILIQCVFSNNSAIRKGGGLFNDNTNPVLTNCVFCGNNSCDGGGMYNTESNPELKNCVFCVNQACGHGGGMCNSDSIYNLKNCTFSGNIANEYGGLSGGTQGSTIQNCIVWGNSPSQSNYYSNVSYSNIQGGCPGTGNLSTDPLFIDPDGPDNDPSTWEDNDYRLSAGSHCNDAGDNRAIQSDVYDIDNDGDIVERIPWDLDGNSRFIDDPWAPDTGYCIAPIIDMGAYERQLTLSSDLNLDGMIDLQDYSSFVSCLSGPDSQSNDIIECIRSDFDSDGDVDLSDFASFQAGYTVTVKFPPPGGMTPVPSGEFHMGDSFNEGYDDELPVHSVNVDAIYMDTCEVTNQQYVDLLNWAYSEGLVTVSGGIVYQAENLTIPFCETLSFTSFSRITWDGDLFGVAEGKEDHPVVLVSWYGAAAYCNWKSMLNGKSLCYDWSTWECNWDAIGYRLPTEAEWEKASRGGKLGNRYPWGDHSPNSNTANYWNSGDPFEDGDFPYTSSVQYFEANDYGFFDMAGNVDEWCNDWYDESYYETSPILNPTGPDEGTIRVFRGGSWFSDPFELRCSFRYWYGPAVRSDGIGFRTVLVVDQ